MFFRKVTRKHGDSTYEYLLLVETVRTPKGPRQRTVHYFGNIAQFSEAQRRRLVGSLSRALGLEEPTPAQLQSLDTRHYADVLALRRLWEELELPTTIGRLARDRAMEFDLELVCFLMTAHRLINPGSKLALTRWLPGVYLQGHDVQAVGVQHCYRALDVVDEIRFELEEALFFRLSDLFARELSLVFYDLTSTYFEGDGCSAAAYGYSRDRRPDQKQLIIALAVDKHGLPITHLTFPGNRVDHQTLDEAVGHLRERFELARAIFVADGGVMTDANIEQLAGSCYQHLIAVPKRRAVVRELVGGIQWCMDDVVGEHVMARVLKRDDAPGITYVVCYNPERAEQEAQIRQRRVQQATEGLQDIQRRVAAGTLRDRDTIIAGASRVLTAAKARRFFRSHSRGDGHFEFAAHQDRLAHAAALDGHYVLRTDAAGLSAEDILGAYKTLQQVEHAFRDLKDCIRLRPIYHYTDARVRGHVFVCMLAYLLHRLLELRLQEAGCPQSAQGALETLEPIRMVRNRLDGTIIDCVIQRRPDGATAILKALGLLPLPAVLAA